MNNNGGDVPGLDIEFNGSQDENKIPNESQEIVEEIKSNVLGCWDTRGLAQAVRYQLEYQNIEY